MRSQADPFFSDLCDRVGRGNLTDSDEEYLRSRIRFTDSETKNDNFKSGKLSIIVTTNAKKDLINNEKLTQLLPEEKEYSCNSIDRVTNLPVGNQLPKQLKGNPGKTGNLETELKLKVGAPIVITSNHSKQKYREDGIVNGARGFVQAIQVNEQNPDQVEVIWIVFNNENVGRLYRFEHQHLKQKFKPGHDRATPFLPVRKNFKAKFGNVEYQRQNFALSLAYAITAHKCQGETLDEVIIDFGPDVKNKIKNYICSGSFYVALTRVREGCKVFLKSYDRSYIQVNKKIEEKITHMIKHRSYVFKKIYLEDKIFEVDGQEIKAGYLNINGLLEGNHDQYLNADKNLSNLDILVLAETKLLANCSKQTLESSLDNWNIIGRYDSKDQRKHMGLLLLSSKRSKCSVKIHNISHKTANREGQNQIEGLIIRLRNGFVFGFIYCRSTPTESEITGIKSNFKECDMLMGDLNLSHRISSDQKKVESLCQGSKVNALKEITRSVSYNQLDYILIKKTLMVSCFATSFHNFISDHKSITVRIGLDDNNLTDEFKQKNTFDQESHLKSKSLETLAMKEFFSYSSESSTDDQSSSNLSEGSIDDVAPIVVERSRLHFKRKFKNQDRATCWLNSCLQMMLALIDHSNPQVELVSELGRELMRLKQDLNAKVLDPSVVKDIIVTTENTRIAKEMSEIELEIADKQQLANRSKQIEDSRFRLGRGQQDVKDFFLCLEANAMSWPDVYMPFTFSMTNSTKCCTCEYIHNHHTQQMFVDLPVPTENKNLKDSIEEHFNMTSTVLVFCEFCQKLVQKEQSAKLTSAASADFLAVILRREAETLEGYKLLENEVISTNDPLIRYKYSTNKSIVVIIEYF